jgi:hypothetical protein
MQTNALFERLTEKEIEEMKKEASMAAVIAGHSNAMSFNEWVRRKDAERRIRTRLMKQAKEEVRQEVFQLA